ncbi:hypothetical protein GI582_04540 [Sulfitobacter sp. BDSS02]|nr:hypothetical protein [Sulfitobacter sp. BDSS02]MBR9848313.1 hypothetical protein [Paracoccaceae bacterium]
MIRFLLPFVLSIAPSASAAQEELDSFMDSMTSFHCVFDLGVNSSEERNFPIMMFESQGRFTTVSRGLPDAQVEETSNGFKILGGEGFEDSIYISRIDGDWKLFSATSDGIIQGSCLNTSQLAYEIVLMLRDSALGAEIFDENQRISSENNRLYNENLALMALVRKLEGEAETSDLVDDALAQALGGITTKTDADYSVLSYADKAAISSALSACVNADEMNEEARRENIKLSFQWNVRFAPHARSIGLILYQNAENEPKEENQLEAFRVAREAILLCSANGFGLQDEKYPTWRNIIVNFNGEDGFSFY